MEGAGKEQIGGPLGHERGCPSNHRRSAAVRYRAKFTSHSELKAELPQPPRRNSDTCPAPSPGIWCSAATQSGLVALFLSSFVTAWGVESKNLSIPSISADGTNLPRSIDLTSRMYHSPCCQQRRIGRGAPPGTIEQSTESRRNAERASGGRIRAIAPALAVASLWRSAGDFAYRIHFRPTGPPGANHAASSRDGGLATAGRAGANRHHGRRTYHDSARHRCRQPRVRHSRRRHPNCGEGACLAARSLDFNPLPSTPSSGGANRPMHCGGWMPTPPFWCSTSPVCTPRR